MSFLKGCIRKYFRYSDTFKKVYKLRLHPTKKGVRGGRMYTCDGCGEVFGMSNLEVDHILPVIEYDKTILDYSIRELWERICCPLDNLQLLCKKRCHLEKSKIEASYRSSYKKYKKAIDDVKSYKNVFFVLNNGEIIEGVDNLKQKHKFLIMSTYKTNKGAQRCAEKLTKT